MKRFRLDDFTKGWFIGEFEPALLKTSLFETAIKRYKRGDRENAHYHRVATEYTVVVAGEFKMNDLTIKAGDIVEIKPGEVVSFECLADGATAVVKTPSVKGDKYEADPPEKLVTKRLNIIIPMAGTGRSFAQAGYTFPKPLIDVGGKPMIQWVIENVKPNCEHHFIFICLKDHYDKYSLREIFLNSTGENFEVVQLTKSTSGAACTVLTAVDYIDSDDDLLIVNADQYIEADINEFIRWSRSSGADGAIMTFESSHPRWSYAKVKNDNEVIETAEKKVISSHATVGIYYFTKGSTFVKSAFKMIEKHITVNGEFYVCPVYNEMILNGDKVKIWEIEKNQMHGMGTIEDLVQFLGYIGRTG